MAETDRHERTESATPKRREEARKRGEIPRSRDLSAAAVMIAAGAALVFMGGTVGRQLADVMRSGLAIPRDNALDPAFLLQAFSTATRRSLTAIAPVLGCTLFAALAAPLALGGWTFSATALAPKFERLNPIAGLGRMFAPTGLIELSKAIAKFLVVALVGYIVLRHQTNALLSLGREPLGQGILHACTLCGSALLSLVAAMILLRPTVFDQCPHVVGEEVWADMTPQADGSYWGKHQWFNSSTCAYVARGNTAFRVLDQQGTFLRVCFSPPENPESQPTIAPDGTNADTLRGCVDSDRIANLPVATPTLRTVATLPPARRSCRSTNLRLRLKQPPGDALKSVQISLNGHRAKSLTAADAAGTQTLTHVPRRRVKLRITAQTVLGRTITGQRTYRACKR